jgi:hypothetical protein
MSSVLKEIAGEVRTRDDFLVSSRTSFASSPFVQISVAGLKAHGSSPTFLQPESLHPIGDDLLIDLRSDQYSADVFEEFLRPALAMEYLKISQLDFRKISFPINQAR